MRAVDLRTKAEKTLAKLERKRGVEIGDINKVEWELRKLKKQLEELKAATRCPLCGHAVKPLDLRDHRKELRSRIDELSQQIDEDKDSKLIKLVREQEKNLTRHKKKVSELDVVQKDRDRVDRLNSEHSGLGAKLQELERTFAYWNDEGNPHRDQLKDMKARLDKQKESSEDLEYRLARVRRRMDRARFWVSGFKECRLYAIEEVLDELRIISNSICPELGLEGWELDYSIEKETKAGSVRRGLNVTIKAPLTDVAVRWESYSGGECQRLRLAGALALSEALLNHAGIETDWEILDEPTQHVSPEGIRDMCESLPIRAARLNRRTFYTDHQAIESLHFASVITVTRKRKGVLIDG